MATTSNPGPAKPRLRQLVLCLCLCLCFSELSGTLVSVSFLPFRPSRHAESPVFRWSLLYGLSGIPWNPALYSMLHHAASQSRSSTCYLVSVKRCRSNANLFHVNILVYRTCSRSAGLPAPRCVAGRHLKLHQALLLEPKHDFSQDCA